MKKILVKGILILFPFFLLTVKKGFSQSEKTEGIIKEMEAAGKLKRVGNILQLKVGSLSDTGKIKKQYENLFKKPDGSNYELKFSIDKEDIKKDTQVPAKLQDGNNPSISVDKCCYKNVATFFAISNSDEQRWNPPAGVTSITVEAWGAGGSGGSHSGGGGGGYIKANFPVSPGTSVTIMVGAGGLGPGNRTTVSVNSTTVFAGGGGKPSESFEDGYPIPGGGFFGVVLSNIIFRNFTGEVGESGKPSMKSNIIQYDVTDFKLLSVMGSGGDAGNSKNTGAIGGQFVSRIPGGALFDATRPSPARVPGGGGAAQSTSEGAAGMVVIHY